MSEDKIPLKYKLIFETILPLVLSLLTSDQVKDLTDHLLDYIEKKVIESPADWDNRVLLPLVAIVRAAWSIPDDDE